MSNGLHFYNFKIAVGFFYLHVTADCEEVKHEAVYRMARRRKEPQDINDVIAKAREKFTQMPLPKGYTMTDDTTIPDSAPDTTIADSAPESAIEAAPMPESAPDAPAPTPAPTELESLHADATALLTRLESFEHEIAEKVKAGLEAILADINAAL